MTDSQHLHLLLVDRQLHARRVARGFAVKCLEGRLLVTQEGLAADFDLRAGDQLVLPVGGLLLIEAIGPALALLRDNARASGGWRTWLAALTRRGSAAAARSGNAGRAAWDECSPPRCPAGPRAVPPGLTLAPGPGAARYAR